MEAARVGWEAAGLRVCGAATAAVAAANLATEAGIESSTIAGWLRADHGGPGLDQVDVLVVDEGAMVDDRAVAELLRRAGTTGTKVVMIGDPQQLRAIGVGGGFAAAHALVDGAVLTENRRPKDAAERAALEVWRDGARTSALAAWAEAGHVHAVDTAEQAHTGMLTAWLDQRRRWEADPHELTERLVVLAATNADTELLNAAARRLLQERGELTGARTYRQAGGRTLELAAGDQVRVRKNDYRSRRDDSQPDVLNGSRGIVRELDEHGRALVEWRRSGPDGHRLQQAWITPDQIAAGALSHGYAMTIAAAQGLTADVALVYGMGADAYSLYPALSRAREARIPNWRERRFGKLPTEELLPGAEDADRAAETARARAADLQARADDARRVLGTPDAPGQQQADAVAAWLDAAAQAVEHVQALEQLLQQAYADQNAARAAQAEAAEQARRGRLALRLDGTSRAEQQQAAAQALAQRLAAEEGQREIRRLLDPALAEARRVMEPAATQLKLPRWPAGNGDELTERLTAYRAALPAYAANLARQDEYEARRLQTQADTQHTTAEKQERRANGLRAEARARAALSPQRSAIESIGRTAHQLATATELAAQQARDAEARRIAEQNRRYEPPAQGRSGPSLGR